ncbi:hypothetical protein A2V82_12085 [candidate division KSB1 bacterium RBG_16_48_16]|nr:MAG: hypothetical protein A2V82_12085 [candidate division KSB1 bacterium RBG_16_48_16]
MKTRNPFGLYLMILLTVLLLSLNVSFAGDGVVSINALKVPVYPGEILKFVCTVDSVDTLVSGAFTLGKYDGVSWASFPFRCTIQDSSVLGSPKLTTYIQGSTDAVHWTDVDTLFAAYTSEVRADSLYDFNNRKYPYYRILTYGVALNRSDTTQDLRFWLYQEDQ